MSNLQIESQTYRARLAENLKQHLGQYVVIRGTDVAHFSQTYESALDWAYERFGLDEPFFVKLVDPDQNVAHFTRDLGPCRT
jgi:hypothetical protein